MKAYVLEGIGKLEYKEAEMPNPREDEVIVKVTSAGICGSDIPRIYQTGTYHFPTIPGHEFAGVVHQAGAEEKSALVGKRVGVFPLIPCMRCEQCKRQAYEMCQSYNYLGSRTDGGFAEYVTVPVWNLIQLPDEVGFEDAAMLEPTCVTLHAIRQADLTRVSTVVVYGCGTIGLLALQWLSSMGAKKLYAIGTREEQKELASTLADVEFCNGRKENAVEFIMQRTGGVGVDLVFECVGVKESLNDSVALAAAGGQVVFVGNPAGDMELEKQIYWQILRRQLTLHGTWNSSFRKEENDDWHSAVRAISEGKIKPSKQITQRYGFDSLKEGLNAMRDKAVFTNKVMIQFP